MADYALNSTAANVAYSGLNKVYLIDHTIDFSASNRAAADTTTINLAAGTVIQDMYYQVVTASTDSSTRTLDIGDAGSATAFVSNADMKTAGVLTRTTATTFPEIYTTADKILITHDHALTTGKLRIVAVAVKL